MRREFVVHSLRSQLASAMCAAQSLPVPRSSLARMLKTLLAHAFELLDDECSLDWSTVQRVAVHALAAWHASRTLGDGLLAPAA
jgi:hypothetical protein